MTVSSSNYKYQYSGNGATTTYAFSALFINTSDLIVNILDSATGLTTTVVEGTDYDVVGTPVNGRYVNGANVVFRAGKIPTATQKITISRSTSLTQNTDFVSNDNLPADTLEGTVDKLTLIAQELLEKISRIVLLPITTLLSGVTYEEPIDGRGFYYDQATNKFKNTGQALNGFAEAATSLAQCASYATQAQTSAASAATSASNAASDAANAVAAVIFTGMEIPYWGTAAPSGYVLANGLTIGNAGSGATNRANADTQALYTLLWNGTTNSELAVSGGKGASAADDWAALKPIATPNHSGRVGIGKDDMSGSAAGVITSASLNGANSVLLGGKGGEQTHINTLSEMAAHSHTITVSYTANTSAGGGSSICHSSGGSAGSNITASSNSQGSGAAHNNTQPWIARNVLIKL